MQKSRKNKNIYHHNSATFPPSVKNSREPETLYHLQTKNLVCRNFVEGGKRQKIAGSEKNLITHSSSSI